MGKTELEKSSLVFTTLFDSGYLDKGLLLYKSLQDVCGTFKLYVVAFDDVCYKVLKEYESISLIPIKLSDFENEELKVAKSNRTEQEYCWTCSCHTIKYVIEHYHESICTYIDADMYFYSNPQVLFDEIKKSGCDVSIIEHRMLRSVETDRMINLSGKYCIEFNTFKATDNGLNILNWWCERCLECCTATYDGIHFGDQKYLDDWTSRFQGVHVLENWGAGVAPWNIQRYRLKSIKKNVPYLYVREEKITVPLVFYHFQAMKFHEKNVDIGINMYPYAADKDLYLFLYKQYLDKIVSLREQLSKKYNINFSHYNIRFSKKEYLRDDIIYERHLYALFGKIWRLCFRKNRDYISYKEIK